MSHFDDVVLPLGIRFGATSTAMDGVQHLILPSGFRKSNQIWDQKLRELVLGLRLDQTEAKALLEIWEVVSSVHSFLARDWRDWHTATDMTDGGESTVTKDDAPLINATTDLAQGNGSETAFQMEKHYQVGANLRRRLIVKPDSGTVLVAVNSVLQTEGVDYTVNYATGVVTFTAAPGAGLSTTWGGAFKIPVHFTADDGFTQQILEGGVVEAGSLTLMEERL